MSYPYPVWSWEPLGNYADYVTALTSPSFIIIVVVVVVLIVLIYDSVYHRCRLFYDASSHTVTALSSWTFLFKKWRCAKAQERLWGKHDEWVTNHVPAIGYVNPPKHAGNSTCTSSWPRLLDILATRATATPFRCSIAQLEAQTRLARRPCSLHDYPKTQPDYSITTPFLLDEPRARLHGRFHVLLTRAPRRQPHRMAPRHPTWRTASVRRQRSVFERRTRQRQ